MMVPFNLPVICQRHDTTQGKYMQYAEKQY